MVFACRTRHGGLDELREVSIQKGVEIGRIPRYWRQPETCCRVGSKSKTVLSFGGHSWVATKPRPKSLEAEYHQIIMTDCHSIDVRT